MSPWHKSLPSYAPVVLRLSLMFVFTWFGVSQITYPSGWTGLVPTWVSEFSGISALTLVKLNGWFEVIMAAFLAVGVLVRYVALILFLHLLMISVSLGLTAVGVRDIGLSFATLALSLFGTDKFCFGYREIDKERG